MALLDRLGRIVTPGRRLIPQIDGLRFVAISLVFFYHIAHYLLVKKAGIGTPGVPIGILMNVGRYGVELFFVISGFVLALPFARARLAGGKPVPLKAYFLRRVTRLEPPYILLLLAAWGIEILSGAGTAAELGRHLLAGIVYQHNTIYGAMNPVLGAAWSLEVEIQFYILTPVLTGIFLLKNSYFRRVLFVVLILAMGALRFFATDWRYVASVLGHLHEFFAGYLLADLYVIDWKEKPIESRAWDLVSIISWTAVWPLVLFEHYFYPVMPLVVLLAYCGALRGKWSRRLFGSPWIVALGGMCYTIYLVHGPVIGTIGNALARLVPPIRFDYAFVVWSLVLTPLTLAIGMTLFVFLERPCMNPTWPSRLVARMRSIPRRSTTNLPSH